MVRFATEQDVEKVNELRKQINDLHVNGRPDIFRSGFCKELQDKAIVFIEDVDKNIIVVEVNGMVRGVACVQYVIKPQTATSNERKFYNVEEFGMDEKFRRQGIGRELFEFIKSDAKARGFDRIELNMWEFNESALKFYESVGFKTYRRYMEFDV